MELNRVSRIDARIPIRHVLISVFDKSGLELLVRGLLEVNPDVRMYSTGGTHAAIAEILEPAQRSQLVQISDYTGQPEMQGGLVKTLDFRIYLGLLSETYNASHATDLKRTDSIEFDMTVVNLYPFDRVVVRPGITLEDARTHIDIGGPTMLRASAKNFLRILAVCDPVDYGALLAELRREGGAVSLQTRYEYAVKTFRHIAEYDRAISEYLSTHGIPEGIYQTTPAT